MGRPIVVFGSFVVDLTSRSTGLPVPGQTILGTSFRMGAGGKGSNQAVAAHRAGADVTLVTKVGEDVLANVALDFYAAEGMRTDFVFRDPDRETGVALIMVDTQTAQNEIVVCTGACNHFLPEDVQRSRSLIEGASILLLQHEINMDAQQSALEIARAAGVTVVLNPAPALPLSDALLRQIDIITPNETEAQALTGISVKTEADAARAARTLLARGVGSVVITLGSRGAYAATKDREVFLPAIAVDAVDTTGAGDAFNGGLVTALSEGKDLFAALRFANAVGALSVTRPGTAPAMPYRTEIDALLSSTEKN